MDHKPPHNAPDGFDWLIRLNNWKLSDNIVQLEATTAHGRTTHLTIRTLSPAIWRVTMQPPNTQLIPTPILIDPDPALLPLDVSEDENDLLISSGDARVKLACDDWFMQFTNAAGKDILRENPGDIDGLGQPFVFPLGFVQGADGISAVSQSFHLKQDEHLYGLGEKFTRLNKVGQRIITWTQDAFGSTSERSHKNIPFLMSTRGYGLLLNTGARITWEIGTTSCQSVSLLSEDSTLDMFIICGDDFTEILQNYALLTGKAAMPPKWSFGLWVSSGGTYRDQESNQAVVDGLETHDIPADVMHIDPWWMTWRQYCDFRWNTEAFPDVAGMIQDWHARGIKICLWEHPYISIESDLFETGKQNDYFLKRPDGEVYIIDYGLSLAPRPDGIVRVATRDTSWNAQVAIVDLTHPEAYTWFQDLHRSVLQMGVDVFKTDFGEDVPEDAVFYNGQTGATMHNLYPLIYNQCVTEVTQQERGYEVVWSRAGTAGSQRFPICWSGDPASDFESLACTIRGGLSIGLSGIPFWSNDIGGYRKMPSPEVYIRWAQFGLFCSHSRMHGDSPREPWIFGDEALEIVRRYVKLRYSLFPYLYSAAHQALTMNVPVIRAMVLAFPNDPNTYDKDLQYMLGNDLLVAPIYDESNERNIYFPAGTWINYHTGDIIHGETNRRVYAPLDTLPLYVRAGSVIPMMPPANRITEGLIDPIILDVYPAPEIAGQLIEDKGATYFSGGLANDVLTLHWQSAITRRFIVQVHGVPEAKSISCTLDNTEIDSLEQRHNDNTLELMLEASSSGTLTITFTDA